MWGRNLQLSTSFCSSYIFQGNFLKAAVHQFYSCQICSMAMEPELLDPPLTLELKVVCLFVFLHCNIVCIHKQLLKETCFLLLPHLPGCLQMFFLLKVVMKDQPKLGSIPQYFFFFISVCQIPLFLFPTVTDASVVVLNDLHPEYNYTLSQPDYN